MKIQQRVTATKFKEQASDAVLAPLYASLEPFYNYLSKANLEVQSHQCEGLQWCMHMETVGFPLSPTVSCKSGIVADDMGLGKTTLMLGLVASRQLEHTLIVVPLPLLAQWKKSIEETLPMKLLVFHGSQKKSITEEDLNSCSVVLTTYNALIPFSSTDETALTQPPFQNPYLYPYTESLNQSESPNQSESHPQTLLHKIAWNRIIYDEAHHMRNSKSKKYIHARQLQTDHSWLCTGTPIQNKLDDLMSLLSFLTNKSHEIYVKTGNIEFESLVKENLLLRRTKQILNTPIPKLHVHDVSVLWKHREEQKLASVFHHDVRMGATQKEIFEELEEPQQEPQQDPQQDPQPQQPTTPAGKLVSYLLSGSNKHVFSKMTRAKKMCISPVLLHKHITTLMDSNLIESSYLDAITKSSKFDAIIENLNRALQNTQNTDKIIIFCSFRKEMELLSRRIQRSCGVSESIIGHYDGKLSYGSRKQLLQKGPRILMMQIQTACEGLNLQDYNEIHFVTPHWNPSVEAQAICRCWRMGQQKETHVYRYQMTRTSSQKLSSVSFDTRVFEKQEQKVKIQEKYVEGANNSWISMVRSLSMVGAKYNCLPPELLDVVSSYL